MKMLPMAAHKGGVMTAKNPLTARRQNGGLRVFEPDFHWPPSSPECSTSSLLTAASALARKGLREYSKLIFIKKKNAN